ncbi:MAG: DUF72 domain-containing protein [Bryobacteraceae bacterium]
MAWPVLPERVAAFANARVLYAIFRHGGKDPEPALEKYFARIELLERKLGPILFQLPPHWTLNLERLAIFPRALPEYQRYAFEFRNPAWNTAEVFRLLERHRAAYCIFRGSPAPNRIALRPGRAESLIQIPNEVVKIFQTDR